MSSTGYRPLRGNASYRDIASAARTLRPALERKTIQLMSFAVLLAQTSEAAANHAKAAFNLAGDILATLFADDKSAITADRAE